MPTPALALVLKILGPKFDPAGRVRVFRASQDPGLLAYYTITGHMGSTDMDPEGTIGVKLNDTLPDIKGLCLEELAHALQYIRDDHVPLGTDTSETYGRELEVAKCMLEQAQAGKLRLPAAEIEHLKKAIAAYGGPR